jgi:hypothetical protein
MPGHQPDVSLAGHNFHKKIHGHCRDGQNVWGACICCVVACASRITCTVSGASAEGSWYSACKRLPHLCLGSAAAGACTPMTALLPLPLRPLLVVPLHVAAALS